MIEKFYYGLLNRVYGYDDYTQQEINSKLIQKMDEVIDSCNNAFEFVDWLKEQGVLNEVTPILNAMVEDGTLANIINQNVFEELNVAIQKLEQRVIALENSTTTAIQDLQQKVTTLETSNTSAIQDLQQRVTTLENNNTTV